MVVWSVGGKFVMGFLRKYIFEVFAPFWESGLSCLGLLSDLSRDGDFSDNFFRQPGFPLFESMGSFKVSVHP